MLDRIVQRHSETALVVRVVRFKDYFVPPEYEAFAARIASRKELGKVEEIDVPITFRNWHLAIEREKEFGGHVREWPDLRSEDEAIIQTELEKDRKAYAELLEKRKREGNT